MTGLPLDEDELIITYALLYNLLSMAEERRLIRLLAFQVGQGRHQHSCKTTEAQGPYS